MTYKNMKTEPARSTLAPETLEIMNRRFPAPLYVHKIREAKEEMLSHLHGLARKGGMDEADVRPVYNALNKTAGEWEAKMKMAYHLWPKNGLPEGFWEKTGFSSLASLSSGASFMDSMEEGVKRVASRRRLEDGVARGICGLWRELCEGTLVGEDGQKTFAYRSDAQEYWRNDVLLERKTGRALKY
ncbi:MAG: hypothetical protein PHF51_04270 [Candidatus ainarchaeum sp.]|nr:hypothetical protein [Candidatus ainarchaeum sp.]